MMSRRIPGYCKNLSPEQICIGHVTLQWGFCDRHDIMQFQRFLHKLGLMYHFDAKASDCLSFLEPKQAEAIQDNVNRMLETCNRLFIDPFDISSRLTKQDDFKPAIDYRTDTARTEHLFFKWMCATFLELERFVTWPQVKAEAIKEKVYPQSDYESMAFTEAYDRFAQEHALVRKSRKKVRGH